MTVEIRERQANDRRFHLATWLALALLASCLIYLLHGIFAYATAGSASESGAFSLLHTWRIPAFYDLHWNLTVTECKIPFDVLATQQLKCNGFPWVGYPPLSLMIGKWLGLGVKDRSWIAVLSSLALIATICHQTWLATNTARSWALITAVALLSFPVQLLIERNNLDAVIYVLLALFCVTTWLPRHAGSLASSSVGIILTAFKIYPFFGITAWAITCLWNRSLRGRPRWLALLLLISQVAVLITVLVTLQSNMLIKAGQLGSHGLLALGYVNLPLIGAFGMAKARLLIKILFAIKAASLLAGLLLNLLLIKPKDLSIATTHQHSALAQGFNYSTLIVMTATAIGCYITTINYDYRLVFLVPFLAAIATIVIGSSQLRPGKRILLASLLIGGLFMCYLPLLFGSTESPLAFKLELLDEMVVAPFVFGGSGALLLLLASKDITQQHPNDLHQTA